MKPSYRFSRQTKRSRWFLFGIVSYLIAIAIVSHIPGTGLIWISVWDKALHFIEYMPLGFLAAGWWIYRRQELGHQKTNRLNVLIFGVIAMVLFGIFDEVHQAFVPRRTASALDAVADVLGGTLGVWLGVKTFLEPRKRKLTAE